MKKPFLLIIVFTVITTGGCKKQSLEGDGSEIIGHWKWQKVIRWNPVSQGQPVDIDTIVAPYDFELRFKSCGKLDFYRDGNRQRTERLRTLTHKDFQSWESYNFKFPNDDTEYSVNLVQDTITTQFWPINTEDENSDFGGPEASFQNFFIRED